MGFYSLNCERCDKRTTHEKLLSEPDDPDDTNAIKHNGRWVLCRECDAGRSKAELPDEVVEFWVTANVEAGMSIQVHPEFIPDGVSLEEYIEQQLVERRNELSREIADGIQKRQVEMSGLPESEELSGFPPNY